MYQLKYINFLCKIWAIISTENQTTFKIKLYMTLFLIFTILMLVIEIQGRSITLFVTVSKSEIFIGSMNTVVLAIESIFTTLSFMTKRKKNYLNMLSKLEEFDSIVYKYAERETNTLRSYLKIIILHIYYVLYIYFSSYIQQSYLFTKAYPYAVFDDVLRYRQSIFLIFVYILLQELKDKITLIKKILEDAIHYNLSIDSTDDESLTYMEKIVNLTKAFSIYTEIVDLFNDIFGWTLLIMYFNYSFLFLISFKLSWTNSLFSPGAMDAFQYTWFICLMLNALV